MKLIRKVQILKNYGETYPLEEQDMAHEWNNYQVSDREVDRDFTSYVSNRQQKDKLNQKHNRLQ